MMLGRWFRSLRGEAAARPAAVEAWSQEVTAAVTVDPPDRVALERLQAWPAAQGIAMEEVELELERIDGALAELAFAARVASEGLPHVRHQHKALGDDVCHLVVSATLVADDGGRSGRLLVSDRRLVFLASPLVAIPWSALRTLTLDDRDLVVVAPSRGAALRLRLGSFADARTVRWLAERLRSRQAPPGGTTT